MDNLPAADVMLVVVAPSVARLHDDSAVLLG